MGISRRSNIRPATNGGNATITKENGKIISISGYVWVDIPETKQNNSNSLYDSNERKNFRYTSKIN